MKHLNELGDPLVAEQRCCSRRYQDLGFGDLLRAAPGEDVAPTDPGSRSRVQGALGRSTSATRQKGGVRGMKGIEKEIDVYSQLEDHMPFGNRGLERQGSPNRPWTTTIGAAAAAHDASRLLRRRSYAVRSSLGRRRRESGVVQSAAWTPGPQPRKSSGRISTPDFGSCGRSRTMMKQPITAQQQGRAT